MNGLFKFMAGAIMLLCQLVNQKGNVHIPHHWGAFVEQLLPLKSNMYQIIWVCACILASVI